MNNGKVNNCSYVVLSNPDDGYAELANAIVMQAVEDYRECKTSISECDTEYMRNHHSGRMNEIERFFKSAYGDMLCYGNGELILDRLKNEDTCRFKREEKRPYRSLL